MAAENAEAPGLIKVVINMRVQPFHLQRLHSHQLVIPPITAMGEASFLSSQFADGEADVEKGPFAKKSGPYSHRGDSWLPASNFNWGDRKTQWESIIREG